ncbi:hypothetical protein J6590_098090 [Homalodisca vitripennis]|nr:hypothetical protein J6590_098090 [Homalodisca vitripennis]
MYLSVLERCLCSVPIRNGNKLARSPEAVIHAATRRREARVNIGYRAIHQTAFGLPTELPPAGTILILPLIHLACACRCEKQRVPASTRYYHQKSDTGHFPFSPSQTLSVMRDFGWFQLRPVPEDPGVQLLSLEPHYKAIETLPIAVRPRALFLLTELPSNWTVVFTMYSEVSSIDLLKLN